MAGQRSPMERRRMRGPKIALTITLAMILGLSIGSLLAGLIATQFLGFHVLTVRTDSMAPTLQRGDVIVVRPTSISQVEAGDIVVYEMGGDRIKVAHRVATVIVLLTEFTDPETGEVSTSMTYRLQTRGDAAALADWNTVEASNLLGEVWFSLPRIGIGVGGMPLQTALLVIAALTSVAWVAWEVRARLRPANRPTWKIELRLTTDHGASWVETKNRWTFAAIGVITALLILVVGRDSVIAWRTSTSVSGSAVVGTWEAPMSEGDSDPEAELDASGASSGQAPLETPSPQLDGEASPGDDSDGGGDSISQ